MMPLTETNVHQVSSKILARLAQSVERETLNLKVVGSTPTSGSIPGGGFPLFLFALRRKSGELPSLTFVHLFSYSFCAALNIRHSPFNFGLSCPFL
ncbi:hypothetical protein B0H63DRAFT_84523 [Podospora didyma]|uniref:Uncharacterized protein n=1 Tax=Podospora didyma TaxID=330526 RepID=A0AAE0K0V4_9PEZI|nr:hypothetical protein B0H63DRAFT_84523 [Podospora didyma]